jgi:transcriptional regulator with XRE-family HTH domain
LGKFSKQSSQSYEVDILIAAMKSAREAAGLSQREVAKRLGFHPTVYGKIERGDRVIDVVEFVHVARALGIDPLKLFADYLLALQHSRLSS